MCFQVKMYKFVQILRNVHVAPIQLKVLLTSPLSLNMCIALTGFAVWWVWVCVVRVDCWGSVLYFATYTCWFMYGVLYSLLFNSIRCLYIEIENRLRFVNYVFCFMILNAIAFVYVRIVVCGNAFLWPANIHIVLFLSFNLYLTKELRFKA